MAGMMIGSAVASTMMMSMALAGTYRQPASVIVVENIPPPQIIVVEGQQQVVPVQMTPDGQPLPQGQMVVQCTPEGTPLPPNTQLIGADGQPIPMSQMVVQTDAEGNPIVGPTGQYLQPGQIIVQIGSDGKLLQPGQIVVLLGPNNSPLIGPDGQPLRSGQPAYGADGQQIQTTEVVADESGNPVLDGEGNLIRLVEIVVQANESGEPMFDATGNLVPASLTVFQTANTQPLQTYAQPAPQTQYNPAPLPAHVIVTQPNQPAPQPEVVVVEKHHLCVVQ